MDIALLVPAPFDTISGGYNYDRRMVAGDSWACRSLRGFPNKTKKISRDI